MKERPVEPVVILKILCNAQRDWQVNKVELKKVEQQTSVVLSGTQQASNKEGKFDFFYYIHLNYLHDLEKCVRGTPLRIKRTV